MVMASLLLLAACQSPSAPGSDPAPNHRVPMSNQKPIAAGPALPADTETQQNNNDTQNAFITTSPVITGSINRTELSEISGLAASTRRVNTLWAINDSGNEPKLFALKHTGESLGSFSVGVDNLDWEDLASAWINGESYLLIAEIGDNFLKKDEHHIYVVPEPVLDDNAATPVMPVYTLRFRYPDGAHDAESMSYAQGWVYILTKEPQVNGKRQASQVYRIPLDWTEQSKIRVAQKIAELAIPPRTIESSLIASLSNVDISQPTAFDIDAQNRHAYALTYRSVYRYKREPDEQWAQVLATPRKRVFTHSLSQAEALAVGTNGVVWFTSEKRPAPLWALPGTP